MTRFIEYKTACDLRLINVGNCFEKQTCNKDTIPNCRFADRERWFQTFVTKLADYPFFKKSTGRKTFKYARVQKPSARLML